MNNCFSCGKIAYDLWVFQSGESIIVLDAGYKYKKEDEEKIKRIGDVNVIITTSKNIEASNDLLNVLNYSANTKLYATEKMDVKLLGENLKNNIKNNFELNFYKDDKTVYNEGGIYFECVKDIEGDDTYSYFMFEKSYIVTSSSMPLTQEFYRATLKNRGK